MKKVKIEKKIFGENAILIEAILNGLIVKNRMKEKENKKKKKNGGK
jgi:hypothetical protein|tara:strand:- start:403 stop:540 length:138 start_codon:yes stop_codon:yes gene_type:complete